MTNCLIQKLYKGNMENMAYQLFFCASKYFKISNVTFSIINRKNIQLQVKKSIESRWP